MAIITYKPPSAGDVMLAQTAEILLTKKKPEKNLVRGKKAISGRGANWPDHSPFRVALISAN